MSKRDDANTRAEATRQLAEAKLDKHIAEVVAKAPPLTPEQKTRLARLLWASKEEDR